MGQQRLCNSYRGLDVIDDDPLPYARHCELSVGRQYGLVTTQRWRDVFCASEFSKNSLKNRVDLFCGSRNTTKFCCCIAYWTSRSPLLYCLGLYFASTSHQPMPLSFQGQWRHTLNCKWNNDDWIVEGESFGFDSSECGCVEGFHYEILHYLPFCFSVRKFNWNEENAYYVNSTTVFN